MEIKNGTRETTCLLDVDSAFGKWLANAFVGSIVSDGDRKQNKDTVKFLSDNPQGKIFRFDDEGTPLKFKQRLAKLSKEKGFDATLPAVYYSRADTVDVADLSSFTPFESEYYESEDKQFEVTIFDDKAAFSYRVMICAWDKYTLDNLMLLVRTYFRQVLMFKDANEKIKSNLLECFPISSSFTAKTQIMNIDVELKVEIDSIGSEMLSDASLPLKEQRLLAKEIEIRVITDVKTAYCIQSVDMKAELLPHELIL
ncbi:hypothetical protein KO527_05355 [Pseudoalteromonas sp. C2R02]|uniref:hypothetical protein n=1 Tax=Pseudoalteromonas sp. C2R02 TaxID=2841565 RepID=UPI001C09F706|nr:hypothetical protein [Pseudoalteromonas sp. C2R02]MBU2968775.1 hypothetical protein [Pseudoalteromonas sp. C2R02]